MKNVKWSLVITLLMALASCSETPVNHSKPEMSVQEREAQPPRTFNQFHNEWDY